MLSEVNPVFDNPKVDLEQVSTAPHIAARMIFTAATTYEDIESCHVGDFGVGPGVLSLGAQAMGAAYVCGFDCDQEALDLASINFATLDVHDIDLVQVDVQSLSLTSDFDTVLMNPPFGTRNSGVDTAFVHKAMKHANAVYSLHKTSTRDHFIRLAGNYNHICNHDHIYNLNLIEIYLFFPQSISNPYILSSQLPTIFHIV